MTWIEEQSARKRRTAIARILRTMIRERKLGSNAQTSEMRIYSECQEWVV